MKIWNRILSVGLALCMAFSLLPPLNVPAADEELSDSLTRLHRAGPDRRCLLPRL